MNYEYECSIGDISDVLRKILQGMDEASQETNEPEPKPKYSDRYREMYLITLEIEKLEVEKQKLEKVNKRMVELFDRLKELKSEV